MGRILEALTQGGNPRAAVSLAPAQNGQAVPTAPEPMEIPFIEVGGPNAAVDASPQVLAFPHRHPAAPAPHPEPAPLLNRATVETDDEPSAVALHPAHPTPVPLPPPAQRFDPALVAFHHPDHPVSEQYRTLLAGVIGQLPGDDPQAVLLTAPVPSAGTTTVLLNLALTRAREGGRRVVVVDAHRHRPAVADRLGLRPGPGLYEVAFRSVPLKWTLQETGQPQCWALTAGEADANGPWPTAEWFRETLDRLRGRFDLVLVDTPSWEDGAEMAGLVPACDAVFLVLRPGEVDSPTVRAVSRLVPQLGSHLGGCILAGR